jgi:hypothetical protein
MSEWCIGNYVIGNDSEVNEVTSLGLRRIFGPKRDEVTGE